MLDAQTRLVFRFILIFFQRDYVLPFFKNWNFINFLKCTNPRFSASRPINLLIGYNLLAVVFIPILFLLFLYISKVNCLLVQTIPSRFFGLTDWSEFLGTSWGFFLRILFVWRHLWMVPKDSFPRNEWT